MSSGIIGLTLVNLLIGSVSSCAVVNIEAGLFRGKVRCVLPQYL